MTAERLRQYKSIKAEIEELAEQIQMLESSDCAGVRQGIPVHKT
ncbi:hypothetical protein [Monoglobus pectinilyticus]